jgi:sodium transport system permease protein
VRTIATVALKEIVDNARDRRTLFSALVFGPLLAPLLFAVLVNIVVARTVSSVEEPFAVPMVGASRAPHLVEFLAARGIRPEGETGVTDFERALADVENGVYDVVLVVDDAFAEEFEARGTGRVSLLFDRSNQRVASRVSRVRAALDAYSRQIASLRLLARGVHPDALMPLRVDELDVSTAAGRAVALLGTLSYFLMLATLIGGFYLAIDTTAGERERGSLEPLLTTPVRRSSLLLGKMAATTCYMWLSLALTLAAFAIAIGQLPLDRLGMSSAFGLSSAVRAFAILAPFAPLGASLMTLVASFTKSYKEAQTYLTLALLVPTLPLVFATMLGVRASGVLMWVPSLSEHLLVTALIKRESVPTFYYWESALATLAIGAMLAWGAIRCYERETAIRG